VLADQTRQAILILQHLLVNPVVTEARLAFGDLFFEDRNGLLDAKQNADRLELELTYDKVTEPDSRPATTKRRVRAVMSITPER
jgi:hypothetical protein